MCAAPFPKAAAPWAKPRFEPSRIYGLSTGGCPIDRSPLQEAAANECADRRHYRDAGDVPDGQEHRAIVHAKHCVEGSADRAGEQAGRSTGRCRVRRRALAECEQDRNEWCERQHWYVFHAGDRHAAKGADGPVFGGHRLHFK